MSEFLRAISPAIRNLLGLWRRKLIFHSLHGKGNMIGKCSRLIRAHERRRPGSLYVVLCDQDEGDCLKLKRTLLDVTKQCGVSGRSCVRIVCRELEAWLLGDRKALEAAYPKSRIDKRAHANPDSVSRPKKLVMRGTASRRPTMVARNVGSKMTAASIKNNRSASFQHFVSGLARLCEKHRKSL